MALVLADRVKETTTTAGTGTVTLLGAATGFQSFAVIGNANTTYYTIAGQTTSEWEVGIGTYTASGTLLARTTVLSNSAGTQPTALTFSAGTKDVFVTYPAEKSINEDASGNVGIGTTSPAAKLNVVGSSVMEGDTTNGIVMTASPTNSTKSLLVEAQEVSPTGCFMRPNGLAFYVIGSSGDDINYYALTTPWDVSTATFVTASPSTAAQNTSPADVFFSPDGLNVFIPGLTATARIFKYTLSVPWDITTLTYTGTSLDVSALSTAPTGVVFNPSGTKMYVSSNTGTPNDAVHHWNLSTAWDLASVSYVGYLSVTAQETAPQGLSFSNDGLRLFVLGSTGDDISVYTLTTPWDLTTAVFLTGYTFASMGLTITSPIGFCISPDGKYSYIVNDIASTATAFQLDIAEYEWNATGTLNANGNLIVYQDLTVNGDVTGPLNVTGTVTSPTLVASNGLMVNSNTVAASYSIPSGSSAMSAGPMSVSGGVVVTVPSGSRWVVI